MPRLSVEARQRVVAVLYSRGYTVTSISESLEQEGVDISKRSLYYLLQVHLTGNIHDLPRGKRYRILTEDMMKYIDEELRQND